MPKSIHFFNEEISYRLRDIRKIRLWIRNAITDEGFDLEAINFIFTSDEHLLTINKEHLDHDYYTDIITFNYNEDKSISGDLFISIDRVKDNAKKLKISFTTELHRVMIHGVLHLIGYNDKTEQEISEMRAKEGFYLAKL